MDPLPPLIKHKSTEPYYTRTTMTYWEIEHIPRADKPPMKPAQVYRAKLHQDIMTYWKMLTYPLLIKHKSTDPYYTMTIWAIEKSTHTQGRQTPHKLSTGLQNPTTPGKYDLSKNWNIPPANQAQVYRDPLHHDSMSYWEIDTYPGQMDPPNWAQVYISLLHMDNIIYWEIETYQGQIDPLLIEYKSTESILHQYSMSYWEINTYPGQTIPPANWAQVYRALLDQHSMSYWEINTYPGQTESPWIQHRSSETYYTRILWPIEKFRHTPC